MPPTKEEAHFLNSLTKFPPTCPPSYPLETERRDTRRGSHSLGLPIDLHKGPAKSTHRPGSDASPLSPDFGTRLASSLWPQNGGTSASRHFSTHSPSTSSKPVSNSKAGAMRVGRLQFTPISPPPKSSLFQLPPTPTAQQPRPPSTPPTLFREKRARGNLPIIKPPGFLSAFLDQDTQKNKRNFMIAIQEADVPIYLDTPGFDVFTLYPSALGTYCSPPALPTVFSRLDVYYHLYAAGRKLSKDDLIPSKCDHEVGILQHAADCVLAEYGAALIEHTAGQNFTFINVERYATCDVIVRISHRLVKIFQEKGVTKDKVVVGIPATEQGVHATRILAKEDGILVNLTMVTGMSHAAVCAEAGAAWITFHFDELEETHRHLGEPSQGIQSIQSTIALFHMHDVETKIMISSFRDAHKILEFPGAHGFSITKDQIVSAQLHSCQRRVPYNSAPNLPEGALIRAKSATWPPQFFDTAKAGGSDGTFVRYFPSRLQTVLSSTQRVLFDKNGNGIRDFLSIVREDVLSYRAFMAQLSNSNTWNRTMMQESVRGLKRTVNSTKDWRSVEEQWKSTTTGRSLPDVEWRPSKLVKRCEIWITRDGRIVAEVPEGWDKDKAAGGKVKRTLGGSVRSRLGPMA